MVAPERPVHRIAALSVFGHDAFEVEPAARLEERGSALFHVIDINDRTGLRRNERLQQGFSLDKRLVAKIPAIEAQQIKRAEMLPSPPAQQVVETRPAVGSETDDLAIEDGITAVEGFGDSATQARKDL